MQYGFLNLDKPSGLNSTAAVGIVKRLSHLPCGHMGTLDPLASGVLPVGVGKASRLFDYFLSKKKQYLATFRFGVTSDTLDSEGEQKVGGSIPTLSQIQSVLSSFEGDISQIPPNYSAKCVAGKRGYQLAREGKEFTLPPKVVHIERITLLGQSGEDSFDFSVTCGGGTYIRSLARDIAAACDTQGLMSALRRTQSGPFALENAVNPMLLTEENLESYLIPTESVLDLPELRPTGEGAVRLFNGIRMPTDLPDGRYKIYQGDSFYGIASVSAGLVAAPTKLC